jgi:hypothetical protein
VDNPLLAAAALRGVDGEAAIPPRDEADVEAAIRHSDDIDEPDERTRSPMEHTEGYAPEIITHDERALSSDDNELSPQEQALRGPDGKPIMSRGPSRGREEDDEAAQEAALAEGRIAPPSP